MLIKKKIFPSPLTHTDQEFEVWRSEMIFFLSSISCQDFLKKVCSNPARLCRAFLRVRLVCYCRIPQVFPEIQNRLCLVVWMTVCGLSDFGRWCWDSRLTNRKARTSSSTCPSAISSPGSLTRTLTTNQHSWYPTLFR